MRLKELVELMAACDGGDNLEVKLEPRQSMGSHELAGDIVVERVKTPDYIRVTRIYVPRPITEIRHFHGAKKK